MTDTNVRKVGVMTAGETTTLGGDATLEDRLRHVFVVSLELPPDVDVDTIRNGVHPKWDSLAHMSLVVAIEDEFDVELSPGHLIRMDTLARAVEILRALGVGD